MMTFHSKESTSQGERKPLNYYINSQVGLERNNFNYGKLFFSSNITSCVHIPADRFTKTKSAYAKVVIKPHSLLNVMCFYHITEVATSMTHQ